MTNEPRDDAAALDTGDTPTGEVPVLDSDVLTVDERLRPVETVLANLRSIPVELGRLIEGRSLDDLMRPAQDGGWGVVEIIPHFLDWEMIYAERLDLILSENPATMQEYDDSLWAIEHGYRDLDPRETYAEFARLRGRLVERLEALPRGDWHRIVVLPKRGRVTLHWLMSSLYDHDTKHLVQARDVLA